MYSFESDLDFLPALRGLEMESREKVRLLLDLIGAETIAYLRSLTDEMRPPAKTQKALRRAGRSRKGRSSPGPIDGRRRAHPGHWADVTGRLAGGYAYRVDPDGEGWTLVLANSVEYAAYLEAAAGYFVLSGVTEAGGPVESALRRAIAIVAPDWTIL